MDDADYRKNLFATTAYGSYAYPPNGTVGEIGLGQLQMGQYLRRQRRCRRGAQQQYGRPGRPVHHARFGSLPDARRGSSTAAEPPSMRQPR
ncbi:MAG: hypothetical protein ACLR8Y_05900 [Alistipes indistinctus]